MKWELRLPQRGAAEAGLIGKVSNDAILLLYYLFGWMEAKGAKRTLIDGREFVWIDYHHAVCENPALFASGEMATKINRLSKMVKSLRIAGLVETKRGGARLYFYLTPTAMALFSRQGVKRLAENCETRVTSN